MNPDKKREFTPYAFGVAYAEANPYLFKYENEVEEIAAVFYTRKSKAWGFFIEGFNKVKARPCNTKN